MISRRLSPEATTTTLTPQYSKRHLCSIPGTHLLRPRLHGSTIYFCTPTSPRKPCFGRVFVSNARNEGDREREAVAAAGGAAAAVQAMNCFPADPTVQVRRCHVWDILLHAWFSLKIDQNHELNWLLQRCLPCPGHLPVSLSCVNPLGT